jgi:hypothetical protein
MLVGGNRPIGASRAKGSTVMMHGFSRTLGLGAALAIGAAGAAQPAIRDGALAAGDALAGAAPIEQAQFLFGGQNYCWYPSGWHGPGWYWCGYAWNNGYGWGGGYGWHGWRGGRPGWHGGGGGFHGGPRHH